MGVWYGQEMILTDQLFLGIMDLWKWYFHSLLGEGLGLFWPLKH